MPVYIRLGISLLYKSGTSRMEGGRDLLFPLISYGLFFSDLANLCIAQRLLELLSIKQGLK